MCSNIPFCLFVCFLNNFISSTIHILLNKESESVKLKAKLLSRVQLFVTPWTVAHQAPPSMGFSRQEYWSELSFSSPGDLPNSGIEPGSPTFQADALTSESLGSTLNKERKIQKRRDKTVF